MHPILLKLGSFEVHTYGLCVFLGLVAGYFFSLQHAKKNGIRDEEFSDIFFWIIIFSFIGARILYLIVEYKFFLQHPMAAALSRSGFVFYGGFIAGLISLFLLAKKHKISFLKLLDAFCFGVPLAHALGRVGCFFEGCCYGKCTLSSIGVEFPANSAAGYLGCRVMPVQLIEAFLLLLIFIILALFFRNSKIRGRLSAAYLFLYAIVRFILEYFRNDYRGSLGFLSTSQIVSIAAIIFSVVLWFRVNAKKDYAAR